MAELVSDKPGVSGLSGLQPGSGRPRQERLRAAPHDWLSLAAAPVFASMALLTGIDGSGMPGMLCLPAQAMPPLTGMAAMYVLMAVFHLAPWLRLLSRR